MFQNSKKEYTRISPDNEISLSLSLNSRTHYPACKALVIRRIWNLDNEYNRITSIACNETPQSLTSLLTIGRTEWQNDEYCAEIVNRQKWPDNERGVVLVIRPTHSPDNETLV